MSDLQPLVVEKDLVERLLPLICCSESKSTCIDNTFCSSKPESWPVIFNGKAMVRLEYPETKKSLPGVSGFGDAYMKWYGDSGCGGLAGDISDMLFTPSLYTLLFDADTGIFGPALAQSLDDAKKAGAPPVGTDSNEAKRRLKKIQTALITQCSILFDDVDGQPKFVPSRPEDLQALSAFFMHVHNINKGGDGGGSGWGGVIIGGGALGIIGAAIYIGYKVVKFIRMSKNGLQDAGLIIKGFADAIEIISRATKKLFGVALPNLGRTIKYIVTFGWLRGKKPPEDIKEAPLVNAPAQPAATAPPAQAPSLEAVQLQDVKPHPDVVLAQLSSLVGSEHHPHEGERFRVLSDTAKVYLANLAIQRWAGEAAMKKAAYIVDDDRLTEGKLPVAFLFKFARQYLRNDSSVDIIESSARVWEVQQRSPQAQRTEPARSSEFHPTPIDVKRQLSSDEGFAKLSRETQDYAAMLAIAVWDHMDLNLKDGFVRVSDRPEYGALPQDFIRMFRKQDLRNKGAIVARAAIYAEMTRRFDYTAEYPFGIVDARIRQVINAWKALPASVRHAFKELPFEPSPDYDGPVALGFLEYLFKVISISTIPRLPVQLSAEPWSEVAAPAMNYQAYDVVKEMEAIAHITPKMRHYPELLRLRAKAAIDAWIILDPKVRGEFTMADFTQEMKKPAREPSGETLPLLFTHFIHNFSAGICTHPRLSGGGKLTGKPEEGTSADAADAAAPARQGKAVVGRASAVAPGAARMIGQTSVDILGMRRASGPVKMQMFSANVMIGAQVTAGAVGNVIPITATAGIRVVTPIAPAPVQGAAMPAPLLMAVGGSLVK
jgi:hypothetical protein